MKKKNIMERKKGVSQLGTIRLLKNSSKRSIMALEQLDCREAQAR
jgi:hypothetical protein